METLKLRRISISNIEFGTVTEIKDKTLFIDKEELVSLLLEDKQLQSVDIKVARPGESKRIIPVKDVIEPRTKLEEKTYTFPGFFCDPNFLSGRGTTVVLDGAAVVTSGKLVNFQEGLIDMKGKGAEYSIFSKKNNIVLLFEPVPGLGKHEHERSVRNGGIKVARFLAEAVKNYPLYEETTYTVPTLAELLGRNSSLPKVIYVCQAIAQGLLHDNYFYGLNAQGCLPVFMNPTELMDGAVVSGNCAAPCHKHTTYHHQNNPIVEDLLLEHEKNINFLGVIVAPVRTAFVEKERICNQVFKIAEMLGADGAIISEDGGGNPEADLMMLTRLFEKRGIKTVLVTDEYAGSDGASPGLADVTPEADAVVTNGNGNERVILPPMDEVIGHIECVDVITGGHSGSLLPDGSVSMEIAGIMGATNELGIENLTTWAI
ncbi:glycine/sarcosine/betaine reductase component B subunit [Aminobacterium mobile]|uniref:glycine/sarcosine/betaine reductase component B subunit n=1 Tax=Aminobacterium mobile TaxID=81467 RepID=UPI0004638630|nr:glycine/sarcosine/betaine reductase component B subunit [Aminobacterium mobile]